jgi:hypothetical protein
VPKVSLLPLDDDVVSPHLYLLRMICDPESRSKPHITIRFFDRLEVPQAYHDTSVNYIDLVEASTFPPARFGPQSEEANLRHTIFIRCKSDDLAPLEHKPDYPESDLHLTIYDGRSATFAKQLLAELRRHKWGIRVPLPPVTKLRVKEIRRAGRRRSKEREISSTVSNLFYSATSVKIESISIDDLPDKERLGLCRSILNSLFKAIRGFERIPTHHRGTLPSNSRPEDPELPEVHLTPPELAMQITKYAVGLLGDSVSIDFGDPAVGTGAFYAALIQAVGQAGISSAFGVDINSDQVAAAQWRWSDKGLRVVKGDYLHMDMLPKRTLILANPPYLRHQGIPSSYKIRLLERASLRTEIKISARSGLYVYFLLLSHDWMAADGVAAWLIPREFMKSIYGSSVRQYLTENVELCRLHDFGSDVPQFENATVAASVVFFRNRLTSPNHEVLLTSGRDLNAPVYSEQVRLRDLQGVSGWSIPHRKAVRANWHDTNIGDVFNVRRGIATGANDFFVMSRIVAEKCGIPECALVPILPKIRRLRKEIIETEADGYPSVEPQLCVIDCSLAEEVVREKYPFMWEYLKKGIDAGVVTRYLVKRRNPWYRQEQRQPAEFLCTYMGRGSSGVLPIRFIWNKSKAIALNTYLMLYPKPELQRALSVSAERSEQLFEILKRTAAETLWEMAHVRAEGLVKIEPRELLNVRLTEVPKWITDAASPRLPLITANE